MAPLKVFTPHEKAVAPADESVIKSSLEWFLCNPTTLNLSSPGNVLPFEYIPAVICGMPVPSPINMITFFAFAGSGDGIVGKVGDTEGASLTYTILSGVLSFTTTDAEQETRKIKQLNIRIRISTLLGNTVFPAMNESDL
jgi:hypothetical protein